MSTTVELERFGSRCSNGGDSGNEQLSSGGSGSENTVITTSSGVTTNFGGAAGGFGNLPPNIVGDFCSPQQGFKEASSLFYTPQSLLQSPQYDIFASPSQANFGRPTFRCAVCHKTLPGSNVMQFNCSHRTCASCVASLRAGAAKGEPNTITGDNNRCPLCSAGLMVPAGFPSNIFLSPEAVDSPRAVPSPELGASSGLSKGSTSRSFSSTTFNGGPRESSMRTGAPNSSFQNMLNELNASAVINNGGGPSMVDIWGRNELSPPSAAFQSAFEAFNLNDDAPVFSPLSPTNPGIGIGPLHQLHQHQLAPQPPLPQQQQHQQYQPQYQQHNQQHLSSSSTSHRQQHQGPLNPTRHHQQLQQHLQAQSQQHVQQQQVQQQQQQPAPLMSPFGAPGALSPSGNTTCQGCGDGERANAFCVQCREFLCPSCILAHQRVKATKQHKFISIQQFFAHIIFQQQQILSQGMLKDVINGGGGVGSLQPLLPLPTYQHQPIPQQAPPPPLHQLVGHRTSVGDMSSMQQPMLPAPTTTTSTSTVVATTTTPLSSSSSSSTTMLMMMGSVGDQMTPGTPTTVAGGGCGRGTMTTTATTTDNESGESSPRGAMTTTSATMGTTTTSGGLSSSVCAFHDARVVCICDGCDGSGLCALCITGHPVAHQITPIGDVRLAINELAKESRMCERACETTLEAVQRMTERVQSSANAAESEIRSTIYNHMSALEERKRDLLTRVGTIRQAKIDVLHAQAERIHSKRGALQQMLKVVDASMDASQCSNNNNCSRSSNNSSAAGSGVGDDVVGADDDARLRDTFEQLVQFQTHESALMSFQLNETDLLKFHAPDAALLTKVRAFGDVESGPCAQTTTIFGENFKRAIACRSSTGSVQLRDACGDLVTNVTMFITNRDVMVSIYAPNGIPVEITSMRQRDSGILEVFYYPMVEGIHTLNVLIRGVPISGCPTTIDVRRGRNYEEIATSGPQFTFGREGSGDGELCRPWGICVDQRGRVLVADRSNNRIQIFDKDGNFLAKFGTGGTRGGQFDRPAGIATNTLNNIIVADKDNHRVQVFDESGNFLLKFGERGRTVGMFNYPWGVATNVNNMIAVSDTRNHRVQIFSPQGQFIRKCGFDSAYFFKNLDSPRGLCYLPDGQLLITDFNNHRLAVLSPRNSSEMKVYGSEGDADGMFVRPQGVKTDPEGNILVCDSRNNRIQVFASDDMRFVASFGFAPPTPGFQMPAELPTPFQAIGGPFGAPGFTTAPTPLMPPARILDRPTDLAVGPDGRIYVVDFGNNCIRVF